MKVHFMYENTVFNPRIELPSHEQELIKDLELNTLFNAMALGDDFLFQIAKSAVLSGTGDLDTILYRQDILKDCLANPAIVRDIYNVAVEAIERRRQYHLGIFSHSPSAVLHSSIQLLMMLVEMIRRLKAITDDHANKFRSRGFKAFFAMISDELNDEYFNIIQEHLRELKFRHGVLVSAELGRGNVGVNYTLRRYQVKRMDCIKRLFSNRLPVYTFYISTRDESGGRALAELRDRGLNHVANAVAQAAEHILSFFSVLRPELAFYIGCLNLYEQLARIGQSVSFPLPVAATERALTFGGLYDVCLALIMKGNVVGNDLKADHKDLVVITGANQGGKSTFLRSLGLAQLMMQCGMFVPAEYFCANICKHVFTHYKRKEDTSMKSGKLDEELARMSNIVDNIASNDMILFNESFSATNEREGSEIARQIVDALLDKRIKVFFVTHMYELAHGFYNRMMNNAIFLRAERQSGGSRTYRITEGEPLQTSYGEDLYNKVFSKT